MATLRGPLLASVIALVIAGSFFNVAEMPDLFPLSSVLVPGLLSGTFTLGIGLLLPERIYFTRSERLAEELRTATGLGEHDAQRVSEKADDARRYARILRTASAEMQPNIAEATHAAADDLDELAKRILLSPQSANSGITIILRAELVVEAVTKFVDFKADAGAKPEEVEKARGLVIVSLQNMSIAANDVHSRLARVKLMEIDVATDVADNLFGKGRKS
ncbi:hypothetical protein OAM69_03080 [bacterium]|nr:hypothetical protein [bacterium]